MKLSDLLNDDTIKIFLDSETKDEIIEELVDLLPPSRTPGLKERILASVMERERIETTGLGEGIAFPHGVAPVGPSLYMAMGLAREPVDFDSFDGAPVRIFFLLVSSEENRALQLKGLARAARLLHNRPLRDALLAARSAAEVMRVIRRDEIRVD
jgi:mannitol/fructose-specific phosphotransferase system IIA component (Ntr-type)